MMHCSQTAKNGGPVKVRLGLMAMTAMTVIGITVATGALPAYANQTDSFNIVTPTGTPYFMQSNDNPTSPLFVTTGGGCLCGAQFSNINGTSKSILGTSEPVYEWNESGTNRCWTYASGAVYMQTCSAGNTNQLFWRRTNTQMVNVAASNAAGVLTCVNATHATNSAPINLMACKDKSQPGWWDQYWKAIDFTP